MNKSLFNLLGCVSAAICSANVAHAQDVIDRESGVDSTVAAPKEFEEGNIPFEARGLDVEEKVGLVLPLELQFTDDQGNISSRPMFDTAGRPIHNQAAIEIRDALVKK